MSGPQRQRKGSATQAVRAGIDRDTAFGAVVPPIFEAVKQNVTLGEICDLFRSELGEYRDPAYL